MVLQISGLPSHSNDVEAGSIHGIPIAGRTPVLVCYKCVFRSQLLSKFLLDEGQIIPRSGGICGPASDRIDALKNPHFGLQVLDLIWLAILTVCRVSVWAEKASSGFIQEPICNHKPLQKLTATM